VKLFFSATVRKGQKGVGIAERAEYGVKEVGRLLGAFRGQERAIRKPVAGEASKENRAIAGPAGSIVEP
jgi:hypothetical protein